MIRYTLPIPSTSLITDPEFAMLMGRECVLRYSYEIESGVTSEELKFEGVEAFKATYFTACSIEMIDSYDNVKEIVDSDWLRTVESNLRNNQATVPNLSHLRIYFDDGPCYEFICTSLTVSSNTR